MRLHPFIIIVLVFLFSALSAESKETYPKEDSKLWVNTSAEYEIDDDWEIELEQEFRYGNNITELEQWLTDAGTSYSFSKLIKAGIFYRLRLITEDEEWRNEVYTNFYISPKIGNLEIDNRIRFHAKFRYDAEPIYYLRYRLTFEYELTEVFSPFISAELFYRLNNDKGDRLTQGRYKAGCDIALSKSHNFDLYFLRELEYNTKKPEYSSIFGLGYKFSF